MPKITFVQPDGTRQTVEAPTGSTTMEVARRHGVRGLRGDCGGEVVCSTCHCYLDEAWVDRSPKPALREKELIDFVWQPKQTSRLSCQLVLTEALDGLVVHVPARQI